MPAPKTPRKIKPIRSLNTQELIERLKLMDRDQRTSLLVDCLCDLRRETLWVMHELSTLDFDPVEFLELLNEQDDDDDDGFSRAVAH